MGVIRSATTITTAQAKQCAADEFSCMFFSAGAPLQAADRRQGSFGTRVLQSSINGLEVCLQKLAASMPTRCFSRQMLLVQAAERRHVSLVSFQRSQDIEARCACR